MLPRVLEPEVMDTEDEACDYDAMDFAEVNRAFVIDFRRIWDTSTPALDVCTGTARIPIELCCQHPIDDLTVVAVDLADHMLALARTNVEAAGLADCISLLKADAKQLPFPAEHFGAVLCNGSIHHIPEPFVCLAEMHRVCAPGCILFVRDLLRPADRTTLDQLVNTYAAGTNEHQRAMFAASLHASLTLDEVREAVARLGYGPETVQQTSDRHWTWATDKAG
jgi:ubiquinone/menaquinone biosynthesis C-methylase UbiE